jgi:hypothetical protein
MTNVPLLVSKLARNVAGACSVSLAGEVNAAVVAAPWAESMAVDNEMADSASASDRSLMSVLLNRIFYARSLAGRGPRLEERSDAECALQDE